MISDNSLKTPLQTVWETQQTALRKKLDAILEEHIINYNLLKYYQDITKLEAEGSLGVKAIAARHGFFVLWRNEALDEFVFMQELDSDKPIFFGEGYSPDNKRSEYYRELVYGPGYALASGAGSTGLGVRIGRGVCLRDTVRDTRGEVAFEDILAKNFSFMAIPIWHKGQKDNTDIPSAIFCLLYPARGAWHKPFEGVIDHSEKKDCLFKLIKGFVKSSVEPVTEVISEFFELQSSAEKMKQLSAVGRKSSKQEEYRSAMLKAIVGTEHDATSGTQKKSHDLLGFRTASVYECGASKKVKPQENLDALFTTLVKRGYASYFGSETEESKFKIECNGTLLESHSWQVCDMGDYILKYLPSSPDKICCDDFKNFWGDVVAKARKTPEGLWTTLVDDEGVSAEVKKNILQAKWNGVLLHVAGGALVGRLVGNESLVRGYEFLQGLVKALPAFPPTIKTCCHVAMILTPDQWSIIDETLQVPGGTDEQIGKLKFELSELPFTRQTLFRLLSTMDKSNLLPPGNSIILALGNGDPICSDFYFSEDQKTIIDHGSYTALARACGDANINLKIEHLPQGYYNLGFFEDGKEVRVGFSVKRNDDGRSKGLVFSFAEGVTFKNQLAEKHREADPETLWPHDVVTSVQQILSTATCAQPLDDNKERHLCYPCASRISNSWEIKCVGGQCDIGEDLRKKLQTEAPKLIKKLHSPSLDAGVNSFVFSPLWLEGTLGEKATCEGFIILGSPRREYDNADRISYSEAQLSAIRSFTDYFEMTIAQERQAAAALAEKRRADEVRHLAGIEPEVRKLIADVTNMKLAAERISRRIAPADFGDFAYSAETVMLFKTESKFTITLTGSEQTIKNACGWDKEEAEQEKTIANLLEEQRVKSTNWVKSILTEQEKKSTVNLDDGMLIAERIMRGGREDWPRYLDADARWPVGMSIKTREGGLKTGEGYHWVVNTDHDPANKSDPAFSLALSLFGLASDNRLLCLLGLNSLHAIAERKQKEKQLLCAAKLLAHRVHFPGDHEDCIFEIQLCAALSSAVVKTFFKRDSEDSIVMELGYEDFVPFIADGKFSLDSEINNCRRWKIYGRPGQFLTGITQLLHELETKDQKKAQLSKINVVSCELSCEVTITCTDNGRNFQEKKLQRSDVKDDKNILNEHGLTSSIINIESCLGSRLKEGDGSGDFCFKHEKQDVDGKPTEFLYIFLRLKAK